LKGLPAIHQYRFLGISRSTAYYTPLTKRDEADFKLLKKIRDVLQNIPFFGYRKVAQALQEANNEVTKKQVRRVMYRFGLCAIYPGKNLSKARQMNKKYPYLLAGKQIRFPNQVWSTDLTYIKLPHGSMYLMAIIDICSRKVLSWRLFNTLDANCYASLIRETIETYGIPAIFNTDQGCQFTSDVFVNVLLEYGVQISMDGRNRALDNIYIERLWRSLKYEDIYIKRYETVKELKAGIDAYFTFYNTKRFHQSLDYCTPDEMYYSNLMNYQEIKVA
jgi:putative transposase